MEKIKSKTKKIVAIALSAVLLAVGLATYFIFRDTEESNPEVEIPGMSVEDGLEQGINLSARLLSVEEYDEYGVSPLADSAISVTATVTSSDATYKTLVWSVAWKDANSTWAKGKTVTEYVTVTPTSEGALTATVSCKQAFGEQVVLKAALKGFEDTIYGTKNVDYAQRVNSVSLTLKQGDYFSLTNASITATTSSTAATATVSFPLFETSYDNWDTSLSTSAVTKTVNGSIGVGTLAASVSPSIFVYLSITEYNTYKALIEKFGGVCSYSNGIVDSNMSNSYYRVCSLSNFDLPTLLGIKNCTSSFNWGGFKQAFSAQCDNFKFYIVISASQGDGSYKQFYQAFKFNASSEKFVTGIDLGSDSIVF